MTPSAQRPDLTNQGNAQLAQKVLSDPSIFPDEFRAWLPRFLGNNVNFSVLQEQLPSVEAEKKVGDVQNAQFENGWVNFGGTNQPALYYKDPFGVVHLGGVVKSGTVPATIFTLPGGYRPQYACLYAVAANDLLGICTVNPDGTVIAHAGSNVYFSLSGITFRQFT